MDGVFRVSIQEAATQLPIPCSDRLNSFYGVFTIWPNAARKRSFPQTADVAPDARRVAREYARHTKITGGPKSTQAVLPAGLVRVSLRTPTDERGSLNTQLF